MQGSCKAYYNLIIVNLGIMYKLYCVFRLKLSIFDKALPDCKFIEVKADNDLKA